MISLLQLFEGVYSHHQPQTPNLSENLIFHPANQIAKGRKRPTKETLADTKEKPITMDNEQIQSVYQMELPHELVKFTTEAGKKRFQSALAAGNAEIFFPLVSQFQTQSHPAFCGLTSLCIVLNALKIDPERVWMSPWRWYVESMFHCCIRIEKVQKSGITLDECGRAARCHGATASVMRDLSLIGLREQVMKTVRGQKDGSFEYLIASYDRKALGQYGTGHFSPIAAYDQDSDSVLVLDVARFKYGPHWIPLRDLLAATKFLDPDVGLPRGFIAIRKQTPDERTNFHGARFQRTMSFSRSKIFFFFVCLAASLVVFSSFTAVIRQRMQCSRT